MSVGDREIDERLTIRCMGVYCTTKWSKITCNRTALICSTSSRRLEATLNLHDCRIFSTMPSASALDSDPTPTILSRACDRYARDGLKFTTWRGVRREGDGEEYRV